MVLFAFNFASDGEKQLFKKTKLFLSEKLIDLLVLRKRFVQVIIKNCFSYALESIPMSPNRFS